MTLEPKSKETIPPQTKTVRNEAFLNLPIQQDSRSAGASATNQPQCWLYVAWCGGRVKVGISSRVKVRLRGIASEAGDPIVTLLFSAPYDSAVEARKVEAVLHHLLWQHRAGREWFSVTRESAMRATKRAVELYARNPIYRWIFPANLSSLEARGLRADAIAKFRRQARGFAKSMVHEFHPYSQTLSGGAT